MSDTLIKVDGVSKKFCRSLKKSLWYGVKDLGNELRGHRHGGNGELRPGEFWAIKDVSFELKRGECLGLVGRNGAGKTTLLRLLNGLVKPDQGRIEISGRVGALIALGAGFNPILTGRENVYVNASVLGITNQEIDEKFDDIIEFADIGEFIDAPVQSYSSGMQVRLGFAIATTLNPDILLLDEVLAVGDAAFRAKCFERIGKVLSGASVIFISHDENQVRRICDSVVVLEGGSVRYAGPTNDALRVYRRENKYTVSSQIISSPLISEAILTLVTPTVAWGGDLELLLRFNSQEEIGIGLFLVHLYIEGTFLSHADLTSYGYRIKAGVNEWRLHIKTLQLVATQCNVSVSIFSEDCKETLIHMINIVSFQMTGHRGYGPPILQGSSIDNFNE
jgi:ABC-type polysaccharide/polyol phosphate transport system ATPase subunit